MGVKMTFFGLKQSEDLENWAAHPTKNSQEYHLNPPPPPPLGVYIPSWLLFYRVWKIMLA